MKPFRLLTNFKDKIKNLFRRHRLTTDDLRLLKSHPFFNALSSEEFHKLVRSTKVIELPEKYVVTKEGSKPNGFFIISHGSLQLFTHDRQGQKILLDKHEVGAHFGEQAIAGHVSKYATVSIETITPSRLLKIATKFLKEYFKKNTQLKPEIIKQGHLQLVNKILNTVPPWEGLRSYLEPQINHVAVYKKNEFVFKLNDPSEFVYIVLLGSIEITIPTTKGISLIKLTAGDLFGELGVLKEVPRAGSAKALEFTRLIRIPAVEFKQYTDSNSEFRDLLKLLSNTYRIKNNGLVSQFFGKTNNMNSITTIYKLPKSRLVAATHTIDNHFIMTDKSNASRQTIYQYKKGTLEVDLHIANKKVVSVSTNGYWRYLDTVCAYLLEQSVVSDALLDDFQNKGIFKGTDPAGEIEIICPCMSVEKDAILDLISNGVTRIEDIMQETGACTVCSTCRPRIQNLLGEKSWILAELKHMENHNEAVISYEIISHEHKLHPHKPGEHLVVMAKIGTHWIERSYTLSDVAENEKLRITIKLKQKGLLSNWLRENANKNMPVYVSQPQGRFILDVASDKPIVCFGGGIGITPFLTYAKALRLHNPKRFMHLIYVVANKSEILFHNELIDIATDMPNFKLTLWDRSLTGYLSDKDILDFATMQPNANIYICGRDDFQSSIASSLAKAHYPRSNIFVEVFTYAAEIKVKSKQN